MPLLSGAMRSLSEASGTPPHTSVLSMVNESFRSRRSLGFSDRPSLGRFGFRPSDLSAARLSTDSPPLAPPSEDVVTPIEEAPERATCMVSLLDSGFLSSSLFAIAMIMYLWVIPINLSPVATKDDYILESWVWLWAAVLFVLESLIDLVWSSYRWITESRLSQDRQAMAENNESWMLPPTNSQQNLLDQPCPCLDKVHWDVWAALWFLIPSLLYLLEAFFDPNICNPVLSWLNVFNMNDADFVALCGKTAASLFVFDAVLGLIGRYCYRRQVRPSDRLLLVQVWHARGFFHIDWPAWGDLMFFLGAVFGVWAEWNADFGLHDKEWLQWLTYILWFIDAVFYLFGSFPVAKSLLKGNNVSLL